MKINALDKKTVVTLGNYALGGVTGIVLFYAQLRGAGFDLSQQNEFVPAISIENFLKTAWTNMLWIFSIFLFHSITPCTFAQPISMARGVTDTFCVMYLLSTFGIKAALASALPQCFSILPAMVIFTQSIINRRKKAVLSGRETCIIKRRDTAQFFLISLLAAGVEAICFKVICEILF